MPRLALYLLGPPRIERDGQAAGVDRRKALALLAYLALTGHPQGRDTLAALFWPEYDQARSHAYLRRTLWALGEALGKEWLTGERETVGLAAAADFWLDVVELRQHVQAVRGHAHESPACGACLDRLTAAADLYRGDFLAGFSLRDSPAFDDWQLFQAETLRREAGEALEMLTNLHAANGAYEAALPVAQRWSSLDPWHEPAHRLLMALYAAAGQRSEALRQYEKCVRALRDELGAAPEAETIALYESIRAGKAAGLVPLAGGGAGAGAVRSRPAPAAGAGEAGTGPAYYLPLQAAPLVGREADVAALGELLRDPNCRLVTIAGPGGIGKTRLAIQAAAETAPAFAGGAAFVPLAAAQDAALIMPAVATALKLPAVRREDVQEQVFEYLAQRELLLLLDNFEQLLAAPGVGDVLVDTLARAPGVKLLVTSRERLNLQAEWVYPLQHLPFPEDGAENSAGYPAVRLFLQSARHTRADFTFSPADLLCVVRICRLVEGLPLAIDLAARWVRVLSCADIASEIERKLTFLSTPARDVPERHRSLATVFAHSWELLGEEERALFRKLSVFRGGFTREAAEHIAGATVFDLASLIDKSLIQGGPARYELHELLRQYASTRLAAAGEVDQVCNRHLQYFMALSEVAASGARTAQQRSWLARLAPERSNVRAALAWALESRATESALRLACVLLDFWMYWGAMAEGRAWLEAGLDQAGEGDQDSSAHTVDPMTRGAALAAAGHLTYLLRDAPLGLARLEASVRLLRKAGAGQELAQALNMLGMDVEWGQGDYARARSLQEESVRLYAQSGDDWGQALALNCLAGALLGLSDFVASHDLFQQSLAIFSRLGDRVFLTWPLLGLGALALRRSDYPAAEVYYGRTLALSRETGNQGEAAWALSILGHIALGREDFDLAAQRYRQALPMASAHAGTIVIHSCLLGLGAVAYARSQLPRAARLFGAAEALRTSAGLAVGSAGSEIPEAAVDPVCRLLGQATFAALQAEGQAMDVEAALAYGMAETE